VPAATSLPILEAVGLHQPFQNSSVFALLTPLLLFGTPLAGNLAQSLSAARITTSAYWSVALEKIGGLAQPKRMGSGPKNS
jgi:hypothetical protein